MFGIFLLFIAGILWQLSDMVLKPKVLPCDKIYSSEEKCGRFHKEVYRSAVKMKFKIASDYGYDLSCEMLKPMVLNPYQGPSGRKVAVLCHGFGTAKYASLTYAEIFLKHGFTVIIYDHRNHGLSGKSYTSMGYFERYDLKKVIDWCCRKFGPDCRIVTHGESMGGATVLLHLEIDNRVRCVIADCAYSDLTLLLKHQIRRFYHFPLFLVQVVSLITYLRAGFRYSEVSPIRVVSQADIPILFIHGKKDKYVPTQMTRDMYDCKRDKKAIYLVAGAKHAESCMVNRIGYEKRVGEFLRTYFYG